MAYHTGRDHRVNLYRYASRGRTPRPAPPFDRLASARYALIGGVQQTPISRRARARPKPPRRRRAEGASPVTPPQSTRCLRRPTARIFFNAERFFANQAPAAADFLTPGRPRGVGGGHHGSSRWSTQVIQRHQPTEEGAGSPRRGRSGRAGAGRGAAITARGCNGRAAGFGNGICVGNRST